MIIINPKYLTINANSLHINVVPIGIVHYSNTTAILNRAIQNTILPTYDAQKKFVPLPVNLSPKLLAYYISTLSKPQEWPFARGSNTTLLQPDDVITDYNWSIEGKNFTTTAIYDKNGILKYEPIMYLTVAKINVTGSSDKLVVTNVLGWTVIQSELHTNIVTSDSCSIKHGSVYPSFTYYAAPLWNLSYDKPINEMSPTASKDLCSSDQSKKVECTATYTNVAYSTFFPNFEFNNGIQVSQSNVQMANGQEQLFSTKCASDISEADNPFVPEFPLTSTLPLLIAFSVFVVIFQIRNRLIRN